MDLCIIWNALWYVAECMYYATAEGAIIDTLINTGAEGRLVDLAALLGGG